MAKTTVTITYAHPGAEPPIFLAGSFTDWQPLEMEPEKVNGEYQFHKLVSVEEGCQFQYKFRLGPGDWWVLNESSPIVADSAGNRNNLLDVPVTALAAPSESEDSDSNHTSNIYTPNTQSSSPEVKEPLPIVVVEKTDDEPRHGDDFGAKASAGQKEAHDMRAKDAEPDYIVLASERDAATAAEVAESAALIDKDIPESTQEENGGIGENGAKPALEKWDESKPNLSGDDGKIDITELPMIKKSNGVEDEKSETDTKDIPRLPTMDDAVSKEREASEAIEAQNVLNNGVDKAFEKPHGRQSSGYTSTPARVFRFDLETSSGTATPHGERAPLLPHERLEPTVEHEETHDAPNLDVGELTPGSGTDEAMLDSPSIEYFPTDQTAILNHIRTASSRLEEDEVEEYPRMEESEPCECQNKAVDERETKPLVHEGEGNVSEEIQESKTVPEAKTSQSSWLLARQSERPVSPSSISIKPAQKQNLFKHIWETIFVGWIGGFFIRLCGGKRQALLAAVAITVSVIAPVVFFKPSGGAR